MVTSGADSPWSWVIAAACCWVTFVIQGLVRSGGVVYVAIIDTYGVTRSQASWPFTLRMAIWNLSGPIAGALSYRWSIRTITFIGVLLVTITNIICWFAKDIYIITFFLGGLQGFGVGMAVTLVPVMINQYFVKYKSTGAGIACAGATAGSFALPPIVEFAIEEYGLGGSFLMMAGITLHGILGASLMRPAEWLSKKRIAINGQNNNKKKYVAIPAKKGDQNLNFLTKPDNLTDVEEVENLLNPVFCSKNKTTKTLKTVRFSNNDHNGKNTNDDENEDSSLLPNFGKSTIIECNDVSNISESNHLKQNGIKSTTNNGNGVLNNGNGVLNNGNEVSNNKTNLFELDQNSQRIDDSALNDYSCKEHLPNGTLQFIETETGYDPQLNLKPVYKPSNGKSIYIVHNQSHKLDGFHNHQEDKKSSNWFQGLTEPAKAACEIIKNPMFLIIASNYSIFFLSYMTYLIVIVDYSLDLGIDRTDCVFLVSTFSIADLIGRVGSGWITDSGIVKRKHLMMGNMILVGGLLAATSLTTTYIAVTAISVCTGLVVGVNLILFYALLEEYLGLRQLPMAIGLMNFSIGVISLVTPLLTGYFRDTMGSYDHLFHLLGGASIFCGLLWILEPLSSRCKNSSPQPSA